MTSPTTTNITVKFFIDDLPPSPNQTKGAHWSRLERIKKDWMERVSGMARYTKHVEHLRGLYDTCHIHFHICVGDNRVHDPDNLNWSVTKPALDGLKGILITDDSIDHVTLSYSYTRTGPKGFWLTIKEINEQ